ncbi:MAG: amidohydrolase family protein [Calditrichaeota bacterium]|nr:amidohydrolase family protein [Calditrichota bacterium]
MKNQKIKTIKNVFIPAGGNTLQLVNIHFHEQIREIEPLSPSSVSWEEISDAQRRASFIKKHGKSSEPLAKDEFDGGYLLLIPGAIDPHVHFDTPGFEFREDFEHGSCAALWGGVTTVVDMPCTSVPPVTNLKNMETKLQAIEGRSYADYALWGGISGTDFTDENGLKRNIYDLARAGVIGFKAYLISGMELFTDLQPIQMKQAAEWTKSAGALLAVHAEDKQLVVSRKKNLQSKGRTDWRAYCEARDIQAEERAVRTMAEICGQTHAAIHIVHLSSERGLNILRRAQSSGLPMTAETCPHYLFFTQDDFERAEIAAFLKTAPPVKFASDKEALWEGLKNGSLNFVTTDHAGCDPESEKSDANFWNVYGGIPGVEHRVPFLFSEGFLKGRLNLEQTVRLLSTNVAEFFNLNEKGALLAGKDADFALIDLWSPWTVRAAEMHSKGRYTPFEGVQFGARVETTFLRGRLCVNRKNGFQTAEKIGRFITRSA